MLNRSVRTLTYFGVAVALFSTPAFADSDDAKAGCKDQMRSEYAVDKFDDVTAVEEGKHDYQVTGYAKRHHEDAKKFHCRFKKGQVVKLTFDGGDTHTGSGGSSSSVSSSAETACMVAVNRNYGPGPERTVANGS